MRIVSNYGYFFHLIIVCICRLLTFAFILRLICVFANACFG